MTADNNQITKNKNIATKLYNKDRKNIFNPSAIFSNIYLMNELVDKDLVYKLINNCNLIDESERNMLKKYQAKITKLSGINVVPVKYYPTSHGVGRVYAEGSLSLQCFKKKIRHTLSRELYYDVDIVNAHPVILHQYCEKNEIKSTYLNNYIKNREEKLIDLIKNLNINRKQAKELVIRLMYLGSIKNWKEENKIEKELPEWLKKLSEEMKEISNEVYKKENEIREKVLKAKKDKNNLASVLSLVIQKIEHHILMVMVHSFTSLDYEVDVLVFDGCMVRKTKEINNETLETVQYDVRINTGYSIVLEIKAMDDGYTDKEMNDVVSDKYNLDNSDDYTLSNIAINLLKNEIIKCEGCYYYYQNPYWVKDPNCDVIWKAITDKLRGFIRDGIANIINSMKSDKIENISLLSRKNIYDECLRKINSSNGSKSILTYFKLSFQSKDDIKIDTYQPYYFCFKIWHMI
tara:strand:+ start:414 stop:1799 length:1386 start_codon:yes stop_codon:yes gene_type:complete